jgi:hypothetical protein
VAEYVYEVSMRLGFSSSFVYTLFKTFDGAMGKVNSLIEESGRPFVTTTFSDGFYASWKEERKSAEDIVHRITINRRVLGP